MQIYKISFKQTDKVYIGMTTKSANERLSEHLRLDKKSALVNAIMKYGKNNIHLSILCECDDYELLCFAEQEAIDKYKSKYPNGYNLTDGGDGNIGYKYTNEQKESNRLGLIEYYKDPAARLRNSERQKIAQNNPKTRAAHLRAITEHYSDEANRKKMSALMKEVMNRPEVKKKLSDSQKEFNKNNPGFMSEKGKKRFSDPANRAKQSERLKKYFKDNPDAASKVWATRRAMKASKA